MKAWAIIVLMLSLSGRSSAARTQEIMGEALAPRDLSATFLFKASPHSHASLSWGALWGRDAEHPAMRLSNKGLTAEQHDEVNKVIKSHFHVDHVLKGWILNWSTPAAQRLDPDGRLRTAGIAVYFLEGLDEEVERLTTALGDPVTDLITHPGRRRRRLYLDTKKYNELKAKSPEWLSAWAEHEVAHIENPHLGETAAQRVAPMPPAPPETASAPPVVKDLKTREAPLASPVAAPAASIDLWCDHVLLWMNENLQDAVPPALELKRNRGDIEKIYERLHLPVELFARDKANTMVTLSPVWVPDLGYIINRSGTPFLMAFTDGKPLRPSMAKRASVFESSMATLLSGEGPAELPKIIRTYNFTFAGRGKVPQIDLGVSPITGKKILITLPKSTPGRSARLTLDEPSFRTPYKTLYFADPVTNQVFTTLHFDMSNPATLTVVQHSPYADQIREEEKEKKLMRDQAAGAFLRLLREALQYSQTKLGVRMGFPEKSAGEIVSRYELGLTGVPEHRLDMVRSWVLAERPDFAMPPLSAQRTLSTTRTSRKSARIAESA